MTAGTRSVASDAGSHLHHNPIGLERHVHRVRGHPFTGPHVEVADRVRRHVVRGAVGADEMDESPFDGRAIVRATKHSASDAEFLRVAELTVVAEKAWLSRPVLWPLVNAWHLVTERGDLIVADRIARNVRVRERRAERERHRRRSSSSDQDGASSMVTHFAFTWCGGRASYAPDESNELRFVPCSFWAS